MRRYSDPVEVRSAQATLPRSPDLDSDDDGKDDGLDAPGDVTTPQAFIWHGRLYVVREVLGHWRERRAWWREALDPALGQQTGIDVASREQHVWRVEASPGRAHGTGVFDLVHDDVPHVGQTDWRLVRVAD